MSSKDNTIIENLDPAVKRSLNDSKRLNDFLSMCRKWFDKNHEILSDNAIYKKPTFSPEEALKIYETVQLDENYVHSIILQSKDVDPKWDFMQEEAKSGIASWVCYTLLIRNLKKAKREQEAKIVLLYMAMRMYSTLYKRRFLYEPKREVIDYVVANLSNKFDIKRLGSFYKAMSKLIESSDTKYSDDLMSNNDGEFLNYITSLRTRIKGFVGNFFNEFKNALDTGAYLNTDTMQMPSSDEEFIPERSSDSQVIISKAKEYSIAFVSNRVDEVLVLRCAKQADVSYKEILNVLENTQKDKVPVMYNIVAALLSLYMSEHRDPDLKKIKSKYWVTFAMSQFIKTNTTNPSINEIKRNFDFILNKYCSRFTATKREATKSAYRKALMLFIVMDVQKKL